MRRWRRWGRSWAAAQAFSFVADVWGLRRRHFRSSLTSGGCGAGGFRSSLTILACGAGGFRSSLTILACGAGGFRSLATFWAAAQAVPFVGDVLACGAGGFRSLATCWAAAQAVFVRWRRFGLRRRRLPSVAALERRSGTRRPTTSISSRALDRGDGGDRALRRANLGCRRLSPRRCTP